MVPKSGFFMEKIILTKGKQTILDGADFAKCVKHKWHFTTTGYACRTVSKNGKQSNIYMHREIMNAKPGQIIDHIDRNKLNNQKSNLRFCTTTINNLNRPAQKNNKLGLKNIYWDKSEQKYRVQKTKEHRRMFLGLFSNLQDAIYASYV